MKSILVQGSLTNSNAFGRILIVYDRQPNGALPAATDVLTFEYYDGCAES